MNSSQPMDQQVNTASSQKQPKLNPFSVRAALETGTASGKPYLLDLSELKKVSGGDTANPGGAVAYVFSPTLR
jgi:hypothetical protein